RPRAKSPLLYCSPIYDRPVRSNGILFDSGDFNMNAMRCSSGRQAVTPVAAFCLLVLLLASLAAPLPALAQAAPAPAAPVSHAGGGEASLRMPDVGSIQLMGVDGRTLLLAGLVVCVLGLGFGLVIFGRIKNLPVHPSMGEISELIYETCK